MGFAINLFPFLHCFLLFCLSDAFIDIGLEQPIVDIAPSSVELSSLESVKDSTNCERILVSGLSRLNIRSYANSVHVGLQLLEKELHANVEICFHRNASVELCSCDEHEWLPLQKRQWDAIISPYESRLIDVRMGKKAVDSLIVSVKEEFQQWRLISLGIGFLLLLLAPIVSQWLPFYYSSSMILGVLLIALIILLQGMKLLPVGRKNLLYLTIYGSVIGAGSYIAKYISTVVNRILMNFSLNEEMHNPVSISLFVGIILVGAAVGCYVVRKFVLSEDGDIDARVILFVKWAMRAAAVIFIVQSTLDTPLALVVLTTSWLICSMITSKEGQHRAKLPEKHLTSGNLSKKRPREASMGHRQVEFLSPSWKNNLKRIDTAGQDGTYAWDNSPTKGLVCTMPDEKSVHHKEHFSSFQEIPRPKFSKNEWNEFTHESTEEALAEWASAPEFKEWFVANARRLELRTSSSDDDSGIQGIASSFSEEEASE